MKRVDLIRTIEGSKSGALAPNSYENVDPLATQGGIGRSHEHVARKLMPRVENAYFSSSSPLSSATSLGRKNPLFAPVSLTASLRTRYEVWNWFKSEKGRLFYIYYGDDRGPAQRVTKVDNRPVEARVSDQQDISLSSFGFHYIQAVSLAGGQADMLAWGVYQIGEWGKLDHEAWAWTLEAGYQLPFLPWHPWLRLGYLRSSGDDDSQDAEHGTFFQILPTARLYALFPFFNMMNTEDRSHTKVLVRALSLRAKGSFSP
jgi:hypothetical protein